MEPTAERAFPDVPWFVEAWDRPLSPLGFPSFYDAWEMVEA